MKDPVIREVARSFLDINGINHQSYADAYKASVRTKLALIITENREKYLNNHTIADAIMKEMVVAWG